MTLDDLTVNFDDVDSENLLADWAWLIGATKKPVLLTAGGDAFLQDKNEGSVHFLDVAAGELSEIASSGQEFEALLTDKDFVLDYFSVDMVMELRKAGQSLAPGQIYSFKTPPVLGGEFALENVAASDIEVHFSLTGQIHEKVSQLPDGAKISSIDIQRD